jgi:hypothetical protein
MCSNENCSCANDCGSACKCKILGIVIPSKAILGQSLIPEKIKLEIIKKMENGKFNEFVVEILGSKKTQIYKSDPETSVDNKTIFYTDHKRWPNIIFDQEKLVFLKEEIGSINLHANKILGDAPISLIDRGLILKDMNALGFHRFRAIAGCNVIFDAIEERGDKIIFSTNDEDYPDVIFNSKNFSFSKRNPIKSGKMVREGLVIGIKNGNILIATGSNKEEIEEIIVDGLTLRHTNEKIPEPLWNYFKETPYFSWTGKILNQ